MSRWRDKKNLHRSNWSDSIYGKTTQPDNNCPKGALSIHSQILNADGYSVRISVNDVEEYYVTHPFDMTRVTEWRKLPTPWQLNHQTHLLGFVLLVLYTNWHFTHEIHMQSCNSYRKTKKNNKVKCKLLTFTRLVFQVFLLEARRFTNDRRQGHWQVMDLQTTQHFTTSHNLGCSSPLWNSRQVITKPLLFCFRIQHGLIRIPNSKFS